ncbi:MAG: hypothetical protein DI576_14100, partial [Actinomyces sp.]
RRRHADLADVDPGVPIVEAGPAHELPEPAWLREQYARTGNLLQSDDRSYRFVIGAVMPLLSRTARARTHVCVGSGGPFSSRWPQ